MRRILTRVPTTIHHHQKGGKTGPTALKAVSTNRLAEN